LGFSADLVSSSSSMPVDIACSPPASSSSSPSPSSSSPSLAPQAAAAKEKHRRATASSGRPGVCVRPALAASFSSGDVTLNEFRTPVCFDTAPILLALAGAPHLTGLLTSGYLIDELQLSLVG